MARRIIECRVSDEYVLGSGVVVGAAGSHDDVVLRLEFGTMWAVLNKYATFRDANGEKPTIVSIMPSMLVDGTAMTYDVPVPAEAKRYKGKMMLTLTGYSLVDGVEEDRATNTATAYFRVLESDFALYDDGTVTPSLAQQTHNEINEFGGIVANLAQNLSSHEGNGEVHLQSGERDKWNAIKSVKSFGQIVSSEESGGTNKWRLTFTDDSYLDIVSQNGRDGAAGKDGASITVLSVSESTEDGGINTVTFSDGKTLTVKNGTKGRTGDRGEQGKQGDPFYISKVYSSVAEMNAGYATDGLPIGAFVVIDTGDVDNEENARLYMKGDAAYSFLTDLSGAQGIQGPRGYQGETPYIQDGYWYIDGVNTNVKAQGSDGATGATGAAGKTPVKGEDYYTAADKAEIVNDVLSSLPTWVGGTY